MHPRFEVRLYESITQLKGINMAFGIDDVLVIAAAGLDLTNTLVETVKAYRKESNYDIELLIEEVRITALKRLDDADSALSEFERMLVEKDIVLDKSLQDVIDQTPWWRPFEGYRLKRIRQSLTALSDAAYGAVDDIASLVRCREQTKQMGVGVSESARLKHDFHARLLAAKSVRGKIDILRSELVRQKQSLF
jgi:hypothetical protein